MKHKWEAMLKNIRLKYAPNLTVIQFVSVYEKWKNDNRSLEFIKYLQVWQELNEVEIPFVGLRKIK